MLGFTPAEGAEDGLQNPGELGFYEVFLGGVYGFLWVLTRCLLGFYWVLLVFYYVLLVVYFKGLVVSARFFLFFEGFLKVFECFFMFVSYGFVILLLFLVVFGCSCCFLFLTRFLVFGKVFGGFKVGVLVGVPKGFCCHF